MNYNIYDMLGRKANKGDFICTTIRNKMTIGFIKNIDKVDPDNNTFRISMIGYNINDLHINRKQFRSPFLLINDFDIDYINKFYNIDLFVELFIRNFNYLNNITVDHIKCPICKKRIKFYYDDSIELHLTENEYLNLKDLDYSIKCYHCESFHIPWNNLISIRNDLYDDILLPMNFSNGSHSKMSDALMNLHFKKLEHPVDIDYFDVHGDLVNVNIEEEHSHMIENEKYSSLSALKST